MEARVESSPGGQDSSASRLTVRLLGPPALLRAYEPLALPPSRKVRALLGYLALASHPVSRVRLCELLWSAPNDPRGELRWGLSKLRGLLDEADRQRVETERDRIRLDLSDCVVDVVEVLGSTPSALERLDLASLRDLAASHGGDFLEGVEIDSVEFQHWLAGRRSEVRAAHIRVIAALARRTPPGTAEALAASRQWLEAVPHDVGAHGLFLSELLGRGMLDDCTRHIAAAQRLFADEGIDFAPLRETWERLKTPGGTAPSPLQATEVVPPQRAEAAPRRASIAVMPFREVISGAIRRSDLGDAIAHDIITRLARLRSLFVIARGSVFALADEETRLAEIGRRLNVDYVATGYLERREDTVVVDVEVANAESSQILWTDRFEATTPDRFAIHDAIGDGIVSSIAAEIESAERNRAILKHPDSLDAWEAYHRGLWHMYRFTAEENALAAGFFRRSVDLDPTFSRAHAGLSFTHWQNAFQRWGDRDAEMRRALDTAGRSLLVDDHNPAAHWSMGRALWLSGDHGQSIAALTRSVELSPNFALGHYALSFVHSQSGDPTLAIAASDQSRRLSPYDPLLFGILGTRAMALVRLGRLEEASDWAVKAAARPNAHVHILAIAAYCLALAGRIDEARNHAERIHRQNPGYRVPEFLDTFRFAPDSVSLYRRAARLIGLD